MLKIEITIQQQGTGAVLAAVNSGCPTHIESCLGLVVMKSIGQVETALRQSGNFTVTNILTGEKSKPSDN